MNLSLRPVCCDDEDFLFDVYASTRAEEMAVVPWSDEQREAFLRMQFKAQSQSYQQQFPGAEYQIVLRNGVKAGRLIVDRTPGRIHLIDIALLPEHRNAGIGSSLIRTLQAEAADAQKTLRLHVESFNPAFRLYERLGFRKAGENGFYWLMEWHPAAEMAPTGVG